MLEADVSIYNHLSVLQFAKYPEGTLEVRDGRYSYSYRFFFSLGLVRAKN